MNAFASDNSMNAAAADWASASSTVRGGVEVAEPTSGAASARTKINQSELADMTAQLAIMTRSGVDVTTALK